MYRIHLTISDNKHQYEELVKVFLKAGEFQIIGNEEDLEKANLEILHPSENIINIEVPYDLVKNEDINKKETEAKNQIKRYIFDELRRLTGQNPDWGIFTGIRPVKNTGELYKREKDFDKVKDILMKDYYVTEEKAQLLIDITKNQNNIIGESPVEAVGLYIGIPFCPTRCVYCSFPSNQGTEKDIETYLGALQKEIDFVSENMEKKGWYPESIYIGGGTPTTLTADQLDRLLCKIVTRFDLSRIREFTVEAGRPDTITEEKLKVIKKYGVHRISINPQSMNEKTLEKIGRKHKPEDIKEAFRLANKLEIEMINTDVIAGLPDEEEADYIKTLKSVIDLKPENITVHTLAIKRASRLKEIDSEYNYKQGKRVRNMLDNGKNMLLEAGYRPYYLYRQKQMTGNFENVGYAKKDTEGIYNIRIMEEAQTIIALGAGGITKVYYPCENRLERVPNVSNFEIYIERIDEMLQRKADNLFKQEAK